MTEIHIYAGLNDEDGDRILLVSADLDPDTGRVTEWPYRLAIAEARSIIKQRRLEDVVIYHGATRDARPVWADAIATERMYPETGTPPEPRRSGGPGNVVAESAVVCPWDARRHRVIPYA